MIYIVVKLFNAIQQSHATAAAAAEDAKAGRGTGKPTLAAPTFEKKGKAKGKNKDNVLGREKERTSSIFLYYPIRLRVFVTETVGRDDFFDMIKSGGVVSRV
jgi:hypothetical protein